MQVLTREQFCQLARLDVETLKSLNRRDQVPGVTVRKGAGDKYTYTPLSALLMIVANEFAVDQRIDRSRAAFLASLGSVVGRRWSDVSRTSESFFIGEDVPEQIMFAVLEFDFDSPHKAPLAVCGTLPEIASSWPNPVRMVLCNITRAAAMLRMRANRHGIGLDDFWSAK